jgi:hypothetical protein
MGLLFLEEKMGKYNKIQRDVLLKQLETAPDEVLALAYLHSLNYTMFGVEITEKWQTAVQNSAQMQKAYEKGYRDACKMQFYLENRDALKADIEKMINESINEKYAKGILMSQEEMLDRFNLGCN